MRGIDIISNGLLLLGFTASLVVFIWSVLMQFGIVN